MIDDNLGGIYLFNGTCFAEAAYSLFTTSVEAIWVRNGLKMMNSRREFLEDHPTQDTWLGSIPHLFQPFLFGHLEGCPTTGSLGDVPTITMVIINHLHPVGWI